MNKSTLARLNPTSRDVGTPSRPETRSARRPASAAAIYTADSLINDSLGTNVETPRRHVRTVDEKEQSANRRKSTVLTPASLRPPAIVSFLENITLHTIFDSDLFRNEDPKRYQIFRLASDHDQGPVLLLTDDGYALVLSSFISDSR
jgi:hypothetical protein